MSGITMPIIKRANRLLNLMKIHQKTCNINSGFTIFSQLTLHRNYAGEVASESKDETSPEATTDNEKKLLQKVEILTKSLETREDDYSELLDKYKRALADGENLRTRLTKQIDDAKIFGIQNFCKDLLEVADILGHATEAVPKEEISDKNPHLKNLYEGLIMTRSSLQQVFKRHGLQTVNPLKEKFNPNLHEALFQKDDSTVPTGTVVEVTKIGYKLNERCIRPALVAVSK